MNLPRCASCLFLLALLNACSNPGTLSGQATPEQANVFKEVITSLSTLTDKISLRDESLNKLMATFGNAKPSEITPTQETPTVDLGDEKIIEPDMAILVKSQNDQALQNRLRQLSKNPQGLEQITLAFYPFVAGSHARYFIKTLKSLFPFETTSYILARAYYKSIATKDSISTEALRKIVNQLSSNQKKQILGYALFIDSTYADSNFRNIIVAESRKLGLSERFFSKSQEDVSGLKATLDAVVIGQEKAKVGLAVAIFNHYKRLEKGMKKSNILVIGPSGTGKTFMVQTLAESLNVPFHIADASNLTQAGYIGGKVKDAVIALTQKANFQLDKVERGIIFFDEIDKMAARSGRADSEEFKRQAQATLLKLIEGIDIEVPRGDEKIIVNTSKILFVCAGAFTGLSEIIYARLKKEDKEAKVDIFSEATNADLIEYGIMPELLGRLPNILALQELSTEDLVRILKNKKSSVLEEFKTLFRVQNIELQFTDESILAIAERAKSFKIGARALRTIVEGIMADLQFRLSSMGAIQSCIITERVVRYNDLPIVTYQSSK
jgi:ATP-dependent Clp protease ATP-binding subunit ClpX